MPQSMRDIEGLRTRREELVSQLDRARNRRDGVVSELATSSSRERGGMERRLGELDQRILQIEADIAATERAITHTHPAVLGLAREAEQAADLARARSQDPIDSDVVGIMAVLGGMMLVPIVFAYSSRLWRRRPTLRPLSVAAEGRIERIEHAVEAVAVEVERVSEGQRFVTRLLSETGAVAAPRGTPDPAHS